MTPIKASEIREVRGTLQETSRNLGRFLHWQAGNVDTPALEALMALETALVKAIEALTDSYTDALGNSQAYVLRCLQIHGSWYPGCGWKYDNHGTTVRIMDSLVRRHLATKCAEETRSGLTYTVYRPSGGGPQ